MAKIRTWYRTSWVETVLRGDQLCPMAGDSHPLFVLCAWDPSDARRVGAAREALMGALPIPAGTQLSFVQTPLDEVNRCIDEMPAAPSRMDFHCSFCGRASTEVKRLVSGPGVFICEGCHARANDRGRGELITCTFCGHAERPGMESRLSETAICDQCLALAGDALRED
jgi:hypothetical protein